MRPLRRVQVRKAEGGVVVEVLEGGQVFEEQIVLRHIADHAFEPFGLEMQIDAVNEDTAGLRPAAPVENIEQRGLPRAAYAHDADQAAAFDAEAEIMQTVVAAGITKIEVLSAKEHSRARCGSIECGLDFRIVDLSAESVPQNGSGPHDMERTALYGRRVEDNSAVFGREDEAGPHIADAQHREAALEIRPHNPAAWHLPEAILRIVDKKTLRQTCGIEGRFGKDAQILQPPLGDCQLPGHGLGYPHGGSRLADLGGKREIVQQKGILIEA